MKITMFTSARNGMPYLANCLESILVAAEGLDVEILYADACSTDGSAECRAICSTRNALLFDTIG